MIRHSLVLEVLVLVLLVSGCAKRPAMLQPSAASPAGGATDVRDGQEPAASKPQPAPRTAGAAPATAPPPTRPAPKEFTTMPDLLDIHFDFDKYDIRPPDAKILDANAEWLKRHADHLILVEGHCDDRGTNGYNLALGERRASVTMNYLVSRGVAATRVTVVSYGEERPLCTGRNEACWAKNRRAHLLVKAQ
jgi:peptidoglycan-associated lipoprotein